MALARQHLHVLRGQSWRRQAAVLGLPLLLGACQSVGLGSAPATQGATARVPDLRSAAPSYDSDEATYVDDVAPRRSAQTRRSEPDSEENQALSTEMNGASLSLLKQNQALEAEVLRMQERVQRVERAMLRLDRRMQLVERNELGRMNGDNDAAGGVAQPAGYEPAARNVDYEGGYGNGFQPVSAPVGGDGAGRITSALQAAPPGSPRGEIDTSPAAFGNRLPSLADSNTGSGSVKQMPEMAIWTIRYESDKVWPDRQQLPLSRDVVALLQQKPGATLFARGNQPNAVAFRERVKAVSRYLSKVTSIDSVPIATMKAGHLDNDTIEIFAAP